MIAFLESLNIPAPLLIILLTILPFCEARGAIPIAIGLGIPPVRAGLICVAAATVLIPVLLYLFQPVLKLLKKLAVFRRFAEALESSISQRAEGKGASKPYTLLFAVSSLPIPMTGVWTASLIAAFLGLDKPRAFLSIAAGNLISCAVLTLIMAVFKKQSALILNVFIIIIAIGTLYTIVKLARDMIKKKTA